MAGIYFLQTAATAADAAMDGKGPDLRITTATGRRRHLQHDLPSTLLPHPMYTEVPGSPPLPPLPEQPAEGKGTHRSAGARRGKQGRLSVASLSLQLRDRKSVV